MDFYMNGEKIDVMLEGEKTVGDVLKSFEITCEENDAAVIGIVIDEKNITAEEFDDVSKQELKDSTKFEFSVITKQTICESFKKTSELFKKLEQEMAQIPIQFQNGKEKEANLSIKSLADSIENFCHVAALASLFKEYSIISIDNKPFNDFFAEFSPVLSDFEQALKDNDTVTIGDLAEYEICPRLHAIAEALDNLN